MAGTPSLIATKLNPPCTRAKLVLRPRLSHLLDAGLRPECRLILISAPAGYGKSTLAATWLAAQRSTYAWLSLEEAENDPVRFLAYLGAALKAVAPEFRSYVSLLSETSQLPGAETVAAGLIDAMPPLVDPFILILDDYHSVTNPYPHEVMRSLVQHLPSKFHLMIVTREDPPLPLNRMRVRNEMAEVRMDDLRFTPEEAREFLQTLGLTLHAEMVASCTERTEGWAAGLQLAALSLQGRNPEEIKAFLAAFGGTHRYIIDYLVDEVLSRQSPVMREFLRRTAVLDRFTAPLCDEVMNRDDSREVLRKIEANNLFLIPLDGEREWFRYHHLFSDSMRMEMGKSERAEIHMRAARWFEDHGDLPEAVKQALAAGEMTEAARLIDAAALQMLVQSERETATLCSWLEALPEEVLRANGGLFTGKPWSLYLAGRHREAEAFLQGIPAAQRAEMPACDRARLESLEALIVSSQGKDGRAAGLARDALVFIVGEADRMTRASTLNTLGASLARLGDTNGAESAFYEANELVEVFPGALISAVTASNLGSLLDLRGRRREAESLCRRSYQSFLDDAGRPSTYGGIPAVNLGVMAYEVNNLFDARLLLETGLELRRSIGYTDDMQGDGILALTLDALGEGAAALETLQDERRRCVSEDEFFAIASVEAELNRRHGEAAAVAHWVEEWHLTPDDLPGMRREPGYLTYVRLLLDLRRPEQALAIADKMAAKAGTEDRQNRLISLRVLQALALEALDRRKAAVAALERAVIQAAPEGYLRAFLDQGPAVAPLLAMVKGSAPAFVERLLAAYDPTENGPSKTQARLIEPLTEREGDLLKLLAEGLSNEEISRRLYISPNTTKWHLKSIFGKLAAGNRTQVVARAREAGLI